MLTKSIVVIILSVLFGYGNLYAEQEQKVQKWPMPILLHHLESDLAHTENVKIDKVLQDSLFRYTNLAIYTAKEFSNQIGWSKQNGKLKCNFPEDCQKMMKQALGINHDVFMVIKKRGDGQYNIRLTLSTDEDKREFVEVAPEVDFIPTIINAMMPDLLGILDVLPEKHGVIHITSFPLGAKVTVDDAYVGETPISISGRNDNLVKLMIKRENHPAVFLNAVFKTSEVKTVRADLITKQGELLVDSDPSGAGVLLDGEMVGTTPTVLKNVLSGNHRVTLQLPPYAEASYPIEVKADDITRLKHEFLNQNGTLIVRCENEGGGKNTDIYLNGSKVSENEYKADLPNGQYKIALVREGFQTKELVVEVTPGKVTTVTQKLEEGLSLKPGQVIKQKPDYLPAIFTTVIGAMLTGFGVFVEIVAQDHYSQANSMADTDPDKQSELDAGRNSRIGGGVLMGVGAGAVVAGIVLFFVPPMKEIAVTPQIDTSDNGVKVGFNLKF